MKKLEELGISPTPWWIGKKDELFFYGSIVCNTKDGRKIVATSNYSFDCHKADDLIMSAAPDMYECLLEAVEEKCTECHEINDYESDIDEDFQMCKDCPVRKWREALKKASGEST